MLLSEITYPRNEIKTGNASSLLARHGFHRLGRGSYGFVYEHPKLDYVLKVFAKRDNGYRQFYDLVKNSSNPHFPNFIGKIMQINEEFLAIRMEKLQKLKQEKYYGLVLAIAENSTDYFNPIPLDQYEQQYPRLKEACDILKNYASWKNFYVDINVNNIMMRDNVPVIIDPWTPWGG